MTYLAPIQQSSISIHALRVEGDVWCSNGDLPID